LDSFYTDLLNQFRAMAWNMVKTLCDASVDVDDLVQEGMVLSLELLERYRGLEDDNLKALCVKSFQNLLRMRRRTRFRAHLRVNVCASVEDIDGIVQDTKWQHDMAGRMMYNELCSILDQFDRQVLDWLIEEGGSVKDAAQTSGRSYFQLYSAVCRVRHKAENLWRCA
jgi:DNA-directed RNA polymerase specialized sigma24 family protein